MHSYIHGLFCKLFRPLRVYEASVKSMLLLFYGIIDGLQEIMAMQSYIAFNMDNKQCLNSH